MRKGVVIAGFGGQGVMLVGELLAEAGMEENKYVTFLPSYGPEQRGGTANCHVVISDTTIASPIVSKPDAIIVFNLPSLDKFEPTVKENGVIIINKSLVPREVRRNDVRVLQIDVQSVAEEIGSPKVMNMILLGAYTEIEKPVSLTTLKKAMSVILTGRKASLIELNEKALDRGAEIAKEFMGVI